MNLRSADPLISIDGIIVDENSKMAQINVPKKFEKQFQPLLHEGSVYIFANLSAIDIKQKGYIYHHQKYMLQFQSAIKLHRLES
ncbi:hypothetical protein BS78_09G034000 [Paspalum vaginatum]|nr:hypothetical protein BS78_09G034000 [Paspalum vaginatum]